jgi:hypothetical protein
LELVLGDATSGERLKQEAQRRESGWDVSEMVETTGFELPGTLSALCDSQAQTVILRWSRARRSDDTEASLRQQSERFQTHFSGCGANV